MACLSSCLAITDAELCNYCCCSASFGVVCYHLVSHSSSFPCCLSLFFVVCCCQASVGVIRLCLASIGVLASVVLMHRSVSFNIIHPCSSSASFVVFFVWFGIVCCQVLLGVVHHRSSSFLVVFDLHCWSSFSSFWLLSVYFCIGALFGVIHVKQSHKFS